MAIKCSCVWQIEKIPITALLQQEGNYYYMRLMAFFQDKLGKPAPER